jgi:hypothetical protein
MQLQMKLEQAQDMEIHVKTVAFVACYLRHFGS